MTLPPIWRKSAEAVAAVATDHADEAEAGRRLAPATVAALVEHGFTRLCLPVAYGGPGLDAGAIVEAIEAVAVADGAAGWCAMIASTTTSMAAFLPPDVATEVFGDPASIAGGVFAPNGAGVAEDGGFRVTGRWPWGSGTQHCDWILGGTRCDDETFRLCFFPVADVVFHDTWYTSGLRGTGSLDYSVDEVFVPAARTMQPGVTRSFVDEPVARFPNFALLAAGIAGVALGIGRRALDELTQLAQGKRPQYSSRTLAQSSYAQVELSRAEAGLRSARAFLLDELATTWDRAAAGESIEIPDRLGIRMAAVHATRSAVAATDAGYTLAGGSSVYSTNVLQRCLRDAHVATQHLMVAPKLDETIGKLLMGQPAETTNF